jgi:HPt (histidine-containing phosphotransfer) domain-containing protein
MTQPETIAPERQTNEQKLQAMLAALWDRSKHTVAERAALLQVAVDLWMEGRLDEPTRLNAVDSAHKLAGVLGTFGLPRGTDLARKAEVLFGESASAGKEEIGQLQLLLAELTRMIEIGPMGPR